MTPKRPREGDANSDPSNASFGSNFEEEEEEEERPRKVLKGTRDDSRASSADASSDWDNSHTETQGTSSIPASGWIESLHVKNFMCHANLELKFGPKLNFVIGHNGSGKSAILTAITLGLGGKANKTSRGSNVKSLIRDNASHADIVLKLRNTDELAYKPELYGRSIIIERRIRRDASSAYSLKSERGVLISTKRAELDAICMQLNIQADNPLNILTQEDAKRFLASTSDNDKYQFFLNGTSLTQLREDYHKFNQALIETQEKVDKETKILPDVRRDYEEMKRKVEESQRAMNSAQEIQHLKEKLVWARIHTQEELIAKLNHTIIKATEKSHEYKTKMEKHMDKVKELTAAYTELTAKNENIPGQIQTLTKDLDECYEKIQFAKSNMIKMETQSKEMKAEKDRYSTELEKLKDTRRVHSARAGEAEQEWKRQQERLEEEIEKLKTEKENDERELEAAIAKELELNQTIDDTKEEVFQTERYQKECQENVKRIEDNIRDLQRRQGNVLRVFGEKMPQLVNLIEQNSRLFQNQPRGPFGKYIRVKETRWQPILDTILGKQMNNFAVTNHQDKAQLQKLMQRVGISDITIIVARDELYNYSHTEPDTSYLTVLRALDFSDEFVKRRLIDSQRIESLILVESWHEAHKLMDIGPKPANVSACFTIDGKQVGGGSRGARTDNLRMWDKAPRFIVDANEQLSVENQKLIGVNERLQEARLQLTQIKDKMSREVTDREKLRRKISTLESKLRSNKDSIQECELEITRNQPADLAALDQEIEETQAHLDSILEQYANLDDNFRKVREELRGYVFKKKELESQVSVIKEEYERVKNESEELVKIRVSEEDASNHWNRKFTEAEAFVKNEEQTKSKMEAQLTEDVGLAEQICERIEVRESPERIEKDIQSMEKILAENMKRQGMSLEELLKRLAESKAAFINAKRDIRELSQFVEYSKEALSMRYGRWEQFRNAIAIRANHWFSYYMSERGYRGRLMFDHNVAQGKGRLLLNVSIGNQVATKKKGVDDKDPKSLSGGEKSFSMICLLLALWDAMSCPIRCLDEFDVFMDAANRSIAIRLLIDVATSKEKQYILITPQNINNVVVTQDVRIQRMPDPERGTSQTHLNV